LGTRKCRIKISGYYFLPALTSPNGVSFVSPDG
jgi:hypothetical protein